MNVTKESTQPTGASEKQFLENSMLNLLAANAFGKLMTYVMEKREENVVESQLMANLLNEAQQSELY